MKSIEQYLQRHAESEAQAALSLWQNSKAIVDRGTNTSTPRYYHTIYNHTLLIPAYRECPNFLQRFAESFGHLKVLLICVINRPEDSPKDCNDSLLSWIDQQLKLLSDPLSAANNQCLMAFSDTAHLLLIDRSSKPIPGKQGVGLARKIAADCAASLIHHGVVNSKIVASTDADTHLPSNYFDVLSQSAEQSPNNKVSALSLPFEHQAFPARENDHLQMAPSEATTTLTHWYEAKLHHYVLGLRSINSPYAFHTIGSCIAFDYQAYCEVRGFPKRAAGEDFYLLNKLAKINPIISHNAPRLIIETRESNRTPFGTGPAVHKIRESLKHVEASSTDAVASLACPTKLLPNQKSPLDQTINSALETQPLFYNPQTFQILARINDCAHLWLQEKTESQNALKHCSLSQQVFDTQKLAPQLTNIVKQFKTQQQRQHAYHNYFDAFRTMKAAHQLRDQALPNVAFATIAQAHYLDFANSDPHEHFQQLKQQVWKPAYFSQ